MTANPDPLVVDGARPAVELVAAIPHGVVSQGERQVLTALACDSYDGRTSAPGARNLAQWTGLNESAVRGILAGLLRPNARRPAFLLVDRTTGGRHRTRYRFALPQPSGAAGRIEDPQPSGTAGPLNPRPTLAQPSPNHATSSDGSGVEPSCNPPVPPESPFPSSKPFPPPEAAATLLSRVDGGRGKSSELVEWIADTDNLPRSVAALVVEHAESDPTTTHSAASRLRSSDDYRRKLVRDIRAGQRAEQLAGRLCPHGVVDGRSIRGADPSRICGECEAAEPAAATERPSA